MMGEEVCDPHHVEGTLERLPGLGLLPVSTQMHGEKITRQVSFRFKGGRQLCRGYEIHMGETFPVEGGKKSPLNLLEEGREDGFWADDKCMGTYIHGILDNAPFIDYLLAPYAGESRRTEFDYWEFKRRQYDLLADHVRKYVDIPAIYKILEEKI